MDEEIHDLEEIEEIAIPVDSRIRSITNKLCGTNFGDTSADNRAIRELWQEACVQNGSVPVRVDQPLWLIDKNWEDWGEAYISKKVESI